MVVPGGNHGGRGGEGLQAGVLPAQQDGSTACRGQAGLRGASTVAPPWIEAVGGPQGVTLGLAEFAKAARPMHVCCLWPCQARQPSLKALSAPSREVGQFCPTQTSKQAGLPSSPVQGVAGAVVCQGEQLGGGLQAQGGRLEAHRLVWRGVGVRAIPARIDSGSTEVFPLWRGAPEGGRG